MIRKSLFSIAVVLFVAGSAFLLTGITKSRNQDLTYSKLLPRQNSLAYTTEWETVKNNADVLIRNIKSQPTDIKSLLALTAIYIQEARNTGNLNYYNEAALKCINTVLEKDPKNFEALSFKATVLLSQHRFAEALAIANDLQRLYPYNAYVYGLLVDGYVESGKYKEAVDAAEKMISVRPDNRSYSRIAYLREIHGDIDGAIEAMIMAVDAGAAGNENTEWGRVQLGKLFEKKGNVIEAKMHYMISLENRKNYPYALAGMARLAAAQKNYNEALTLYMQADSLIFDHTFQEGIAEIYILTNQVERARKISAGILNNMKRLSMSNNGSGQNEDHEIAHAWMGVGNYDKALEYAMLEFNRRPLNIEVNETVALVYYGNGDYQKAVPYIETALRTNCKNPELLCHAGLIYAKTGNKEKAKLFLSAGLKNNPVIPPSLKMESEQLLKSLD